MCSRPTIAGVQVDIKAARSDVYAAVIEGRLAMKIGPGEWSPKKAGLDVGQKAWLVAISGYMFTIWEAAF